MFNYAQNLVNNIWEESRAIANAYNGPLVHALCNQARVLTRSQYSSSYSIADGGKIKP